MFCLLDARNEKLEKFIIPFILPFEAGTREFYPPGGVVAQQPGQWYGKISGNWKTGVLQCTWEAYLYEIVPRELGRGRVGVAQGNWHWCCRGGLCFSFSRV